MDLKGRDFLKLLDFTPEEIEYLLDLAADLKDKKKKGIPVDTLRGKNVALIFEKMTATYLSALYAVPQFCSRLPKTMRAQRAMCSRKPLKAKPARRRHLCKGNTAQFPPSGLSTASAAAARHLRCQNAR